MTSTSEIKSNIAIVIHKDSPGDEMANLDRQIGNTKWYIAKNKEFLGKQDMKLQWTDDPSLPIKYYESTNDKKPIKLGYIKKTIKDNELVEIDSEEKFNEIFKKSSGEDLTKRIHTRIQSNVYTIPDQNNVKLPGNENDLIKRRTDLILNAMLEQIDSWEKMFKSLKTCDVSLILKPSNQTKVIKIKNKIVSPKPIIKKVKFNEVDDEDVNYKKTPKLITTCDGKEDCKCRKWWGRTIRDDSNCESDILDDDDKRILQFCSYSCAATREEDLYAYEN
jgi:hypothetical protein